MESSTAVMQLVETTEKLLAAVRKEWSVNSKHKQPPHHQQQQQKQSDHALSSSLSEAHYAKHMEQLVFVSSFAADIAHSMYCFVKAVQAAGTTVLGTYNWLR